ncbi:MAG: cell division protein ZapB [Deltaproteobacteria bacterium]|jgi:hypothetical protein|nr:cell division protein ZapB [Deltaproteobacteria bacterium]
MDFSKFELLEKKVIAVLDKKNSAEQMCESLKQDLIKAKDDQDQANQLVDELKKDRQLVLERIDALLAKLD